MTEEKKFVKYTVKNGRDLSRIHKKLSVMDVLQKKIDVEKQWTWEDEKLMEAYTCKKNMDEFRKYGEKN